MYHSITFGDKNTWADWHLIPSSRPVFSPPPVNSKVVSIPGCNGVLDLTELLTGYPTYGNRSGSFEFIVVNGYRDWAVAYSDISAYLHGKRMRAVLEDDPEFFYEGRFSVNAWKSGPNYSTITIDYNVAPYKKSVLSSQDEWMWDTFNFQTGIVRHALVDIPVSGSATIEVIGDQERIPLSVTASSDMEVEFEGNYYEVREGTNTITGIVLGQGINELTFSGEGTVSIDYRGGRL